MSNSRTANLGWVVAAALFGIMVGSGFQNPSIKLGVVDITRVIADSEYGKERTRVMNDMKKARVGLFTFIDEYRVLTVEQANRLKDLMLKLNRTKEEDAEIERIKADVIAASKRSVEISTKTNLTPEERTLIEEYARRSQYMNQALQRWYTEGENEVSSFYDQSKIEGFKRARAAVSEVAGKDSYTMVFESSVVPFGTNDLSDQALVAMNAKGNQP